MTEGLRTSRPVLHPEALLGKHAVVTGAARGIGAATARVLAAAGAVVTLLDKDHPGEVAEDIVAAGGTATAGALDVTDRAACLEVIGALPRVDTVVTSAGIYGEPVALDELEPDDFHRVLGVNVDGAMWTIAAALPSLRVAGGRVVCVGSLAGKIGGVMSGPQYVASKGALHALVKWLARGEAKSGILVNGVAPGAVATDMIEGRGYTGDIAPIGRLAQAEDVAEVVGFLTSAGASYMTGTIVDVNGGMYMGS